MVNQSSQYYQSKIFAVCSKVKHFKTTYGQRFFWSNFLKHRLVWGRIWSEFTQVYSGMTAFDSIQNQYLIWVYSLSHPNQVYSGMTAFDNIREQGGRTKVVVVTLAQIYSLTCFSPDYNSWKSVESHDCSNILTPVSHQIITVQSQ